MTMGRVVVLLKPFGCKPKGSREILFGVQEVERAGVDQQLCSSMFLCCKMRI